MARKSCPTGQTWSRLKLKCVAKPGGKKGLKPKSKLKLRKTTMTDEEARAYNIESTKIDKANIARGEHYTNIRPLRTGLSSPPKGQRGDYITSAGHYAWKKAKKKR